MTQTKFDTVDLSKLPSLQSFNSAEISASLKKMTPSQLGFYNVMRLAVIGAAGYGLWVYVLPALFVAVGQMIAIAAGLGILVFAFLARKGIFKMLQNAARWLDKRAITQNVWREFERQKEKLLDAKKKFYESFGRMASLASETKAKAFASEKTAKEYQEKAIELKTKADNIREELKKIVDKDTDEYTSAFNTATRAAAEANGLLLKYNQAKDLTEKYGARAAIMGKLVRKLDTGKTYIDIKIMEFDNTVDMLKVDYNYFKESADASSQMKQSLTFGEQWELEYAIEATKAMTASYISTTDMNLRDIENLTTNFNIDNDAIFSKLDRLTENIETGEEKIPDAAQFTRANYKITEKDKASAGFGSEMFS